MQVGLGPSSRHPLCTCGTTDLGRHQGSRALHSAPPTPVLYNPPGHPARGHHTGGVGAPGPAPVSTCPEVSGSRPPTALATLRGLRGPSAAAVGHHPGFNNPVPSASGSCSFCFARASRTFQGWLPLLACQPAACGPSHSHPYQSSLQATSLHKCTFPYHLRSLQMPFSCPEAHICVPTFLPLVCCSATSEAFLYAL